MPLPAAPARGVLATWLYTLGSIVFLMLMLDAMLLLLFAQAFQSTRAPLDAVLLVLMLVTALVTLRYCWFLRVGLGGGLPHPAWTTALIAPAAVIWVIGLASTDGALFAAIPLWTTICVIAPLLARGARWGLLALVAAITVAHPLLASLVGHSVAIDGRSVSGLLILYGAMLPFMVISALWWWEIVVTMDRHRASAAQLAVAQERLRFASDLHDIQGHHLQVIALKAELAERLLERDPAAAREHLHETRMIAKQALEETRSLVAGYRDVDLAAELENAREVLTISGAQCTLTIGELPDDAEVRRALALVVREATTNILRHSSATAAAIELTLDDRGVTLSVSNDEAGTAPAPGNGGNGLAGLRERLASLGGSLDARHDGAQFTLVAFVPARAEVAA